MGLVKWFLKFSYCNLIITIINHNYSIFREVQNMLPKFEKQQIELLDESDLALDNSNLNHNDIFNIVSGRISLKMLNRIVNSNVDVIDVFEEDAMALEVSEASVTLVSRVN